MSKGSRHWCFTQNNPTDEDVGILNTIECRYVTYGRETAPETGTPHLQGFISFKDCKTLSAVKKYLPRAHLEPKCKKSTFDQAINYSHKDDASPYERGDRPQDPINQGLNERKRWSDARSAAMGGRFSDIPDDLYIRYQASFKRMRKEDKPDPDDLPEAPTYGIWIYGPTRTGKSHMARSEYQPLYLKDINKWWDGYDGQPNVLIDEFAPEHAPFMTHNIKKWVDRWPFSAEMKGSRTVIRPEKIIITSNYSIEECFPPGVDRDAIQARFKVIHKLKKENGNEKKVQDGASQEEVGAID